MPDYNSAPSVPRVTGNRTVRSTITDGTGRSYYLPRHRHESRSFPVMVVAHQPTYGYHFPLFAPVRISGPVSSHSDRTIRVKGRDPRAAYDNGTDRVARYSPGDLCESPVHDGPVHDGPVHDGPVHDSTYQPKHRAPGLALGPVTSTGTDQQ